MENLLTNTQFTGKFLIHLSGVDSTNNYAKEYLSKTSPKNGAVILADEQLAGRGQAGNSWESSPGMNLTFSIIYYPDFLSASDQFYLNRAVSLGLVAAVRNFLTGNSNVSIKWPNDLLANGRKIAGILIENIINGTQLSASIIGIGLNVNQRNFTGAFEATSLSKEMEMDADRMEVLKKVLEHIESCYLKLQAGKLQELKTNYLQQLYRLDEWHTYADHTGSFRGKIIGVNDFGKLRIETNNAIREYGTKEIQFL